MDTKVYVDRLSAIDWGSFDTAYGPANSIPGYLKLLVSKDGEVALEASHQL